MRGLAFSVCTPRGPLSLLWGQGTAHATLASPKTARLRMPPAGEFVSVEKVEGVLSQSPLVEQVSVQLELHRRQAVSAILHV